MFDKDAYFNYLSVDIVNNKHLIDKLYVSNEFANKTSSLIDLEVRSELRARKSIIKFLDRMIKQLDECICSSEYRQLYKCCLVNSKNYLNMMNNKFLSKLSYSVFGKEYPCNAFDNFGSKYIGSKFLLSDYEYDSIFISKGIYYNFILYTMLYASNVQNYENFEAIVDDISGLTYLVRGWYTYEYDLESEEMKRNKSLIEHIVSDKNYKDNQKLRDTLILILERCMAVKERDKEDFLWRLNQLYEDIDSLGDKTLSEIDINKILEDFFRTGQYCKLLLYGNRYQYLKKVEIEDNVNIKNEIYSNIMTLSYDMFSELNDDCGCDSFIRCMNIVFDSDSYHELFNKLRLLNDASKLYEVGRKEASFNLIKEISSVDHKEKLCGKIVSYSNCMNEVTKPKRIIDRMKDLYGKIDSSICYDYMDKIHQEAMDWESMEKEILTQRKNPMNRIKGHLKKVKFWRD